ncbi:Fanconi anemia group J protein [Nowakowskiella sp. JEL0078]|nr:Fanconi anemia group J protein [Nowakowskiella sp. JEL0078]
MTGLLTALNTESNALLESPTGTGKTLALLISTIAWREARQRTYLEAVSKRKTQERERIKLSFVATQETWKSQGSNVVESSFFQGSETTETKLQKNFNKMDTNLEPLPPKLPKIYFASRTQKQLQQAVKQLRMSTYKPKTSTLASREHYCINPKVRKSASINEECNKFLNEDLCMYFHGSHDFRHRNMESPVWDIEDLVSVGKKRKVCPYFASRNLATTADLVFVPYNYIIDPQIREASEIDLQNSIVIIDEAHNIEVTCMESGSFEISEQQLRIIQEEISGILGRLTNQEDVAAHEESPENIYRILHATIIALIENVNNPKGRRQNLDAFSFLHLLNGSDGLLSLGIRDEDVARIKKCTAQAISISNSEREEKKSRKLEIVISDEASESLQSSLALSEFSLRQLKSLSMVLNYIILGYPDDYRVAVTGKPSDGTKAISFWAMSPHLIFKEISEVSLSVILASGTLSPIKSLICELGVSFPIILEADHVVENSQVWCGIVSTASNNSKLENTFNNMQTYHYRDALGMTILDIIKIVCDGVLVFLSSYATMENLIERWKQTGLFEEINSHKQIFMEPRNNQGGKFDKMVKNYESVLENGKGAVFFCIFRGKMSEGIDFADKKARAVLAIGIPYPNVKDPQKLKGHFKRGNVVFNSVSNLAVRHFEQLTKHLVDALDTKMIGAQLF